MKTYSVVQGSPEWDAIRFLARTASEAPAMMGASPKVTRTALLRAKATGDVKEYSDWVRDHLFERGHQIEAATRPLVEELIGEDLFPGTFGTDDGYLLASPDGVTMDGTTGFECKSWNKSLVAMVKAKELSPEYYWQLEQQLLVAEMERIIFAVSDGTKAHFEWMEYTAVPGRAEELMAGWRQFDQDVVNFKHVEALPPEPARALMALPTLSVRLVGEVTESNLDLYKSKALSFIANINTDLNSDEDFANAELAVKFCGSAESELETVKTMALAQTASIDELFRTVDHISASLKAKRIQIEKLVAARKESIRAEIRQSGIDAFSTHVRMLADRLGGPYLPTIAVDFAAVMKNKRTVESLRDAVETELARAKIAANEHADRIQLNLRAFDTLASEYGFLFSDKPALVLKTVDDCEVAIKHRISEHVAKKAREEEAQRERIRQEEISRLQREAAARATEDDKSRSVPLAAAVTSAAHPRPLGASGHRASPAPVGRSVIAPRANTSTGDAEDVDVTVVSMSEFIAYVAANPDFQCWLNVDTELAALYAKRNPGVEIAGLRFRRYLPQVA